MQCGLHTAGAGIATTLSVSFFIAVPTGFVVTAAFFGVAPDATRTLVVLGLFLLRGLSIITVRIQLIREYARRLECMNNLRVIGLKYVDNETAYPVSNSRVTYQDDPFLNQLHFEGEVRPIPPNIIEKLQSDEVMAVVDDDGVGSGNTSLPRPENRWADAGINPDLNDLDFSDDQVRETINRAIGGVNEDKQLD